MPWLMFFGLRHHGLPPNFNLACNVQRVVIASRILDQIIIKVITNILIVVIIEIHITHSNDDDNDDNVQSPSHVSELRLKQFYYHTTQFSKNMGLVLGYIGILEKKMETNIMGYMGFRV